MRGAAHLPTLQLITAHNSRCLEVFYCSSAVSSQLQRGQTSATLQWAVAVVDEAVRIRNWLITVECKKNSWLWSVNFLLLQSHSLLLLLIVNHAWDHTLMRGLQRAVTVVDETVRIRNWLITVECNSEFDLHWHWTRVALTFLSVTLSSEDPTLLPYRILIVIASSIKQHQYECF